MAIGSKKPRSLLAPMPMDDTAQQLHEISDGLGKYDPAKFLVPGSDAKGVSERIYARVPPAMLRQVEVVVRGKKFPFRTNGDILRWGLWTALKLLERMEPTPNTFMVRMEAVNAVLLDEIYLQEYAAIFEKLESVIARHVSSGAVGEARKLVAKVKGEFQHIEEPYWQKRCLEELSSRWGHLIRSEARTALIGGEGGDHDEQEQ